MDRNKNDPEEQSWIDAQAILASARGMPAGAERIEALRRAGKIRFEADKLRQQKEARIRAHSLQLREEMTAENNGKKTSLTHI